MRIRDARWVAATLLCLAPAVARPFGWNANAGLAYLRADSWAPEVPRDTQPRLDVALQLSLHGDIVSPAMFAYGGTVGYSLYSTSVNGSRTESGSSLTYSLQASALSHPTSPLGLSAFASRTDSRTHDYLVANTIGDTTTSSYGATLTTHGDATPTATLGFIRTDSNQTLGPVLDHDRLLTTVNGSVSSGGGPFTISGNYRGDFSDGDWVADKYQAHSVSVSGASRFGSDSDLTFHDSYYRRIPTFEEAGSFASEINSFFATYRNGTEKGQRSRLGYFDSRATTTIDSTSEQATSNSLRYNRDLPLPRPELFLHGSADFSATSQRRTGARTLNASGATAGLQLWWSRTFGEKKIAPGQTESWSYDLAGGPLVSYLDPSTGPVVMGYGGSAHARLGVPLGNRRLGGTYDVSYGTNLHAEAGWTLAQSGSIHLRGPAASGGYDLGLNFTATRRESPVFGPSASRSLNALGSYRWSRFRISGQAQLSNGTLPGTSSFIGDGLFIPTGFETREASLYAHASTVLASGFSAFLDGRYSQSVNPGQPSLSSREAGAGFTYRYAAFDLSLDDRITWYGSYNRNVLFVRVSRAMGSGF